MEIVGQVEIDDYCQKILALRWPHTKKWGDIRQLRGEDAIRACGHIDLISGGFPCQDISTAGKGAGITGERSGLWKEMLRIIREVRPRYVLVENVTALLGRGLGVVLGDLAEIGYDTEWDCIPASAVGAPHQRDRIWVVAYSNASREWGNERESKIKKNAMAHSAFIGRKRRPSISGQTKSRRPHSKTSGYCFQISDTKSNTRRVFNRNSAAHADHWTTEPNVGRVAHGIASRVDRLKLLGNGQVVQVVQYVGEQILRFDKEINGNL